MYISLTGKNFPEYQPSWFKKARDPTSGNLIHLFPNEYWRQLDKDEAYPTKFVQAMTDAGYLAALIPEEYGGIGVGITETSIILEEVHRSGGNAAACHAQMYTMGTVLKHGSEEQKQAFLPGIASGDQTVKTAEKRSELNRSTGAIAVAWEGAGGARAAAINPAPAW